MPSTESTTIASVARLWRYPVKSMQGESCDAVQLVSTGVDGDRGFGVLDVASGTVITAKREGRLLEATSRWSSGELVVELPDGAHYARGLELDAALTHWLGRPVALVDATTHGAALYESPEDFERDDSTLEQWEGPPGSFVDASPLHVLTTADLATLANERPDLQWDVRRFRPNVLLEVAGSAAGPLATGERLRLGEGEIAVQGGCVRCVMTTRPQPANLARQLDVLRHINRAHRREVGVLATVVHGGVVCVGDAVETVR